MGDDRFHLSDEQWHLIKVHLPANDDGRKITSDRSALCGIFHVLLSGLSWRDCPAEFGPPLTLLNRFNRWIDRGIWPRIVIDLAKFPGAQPLALPVYATDLAGRIIFFNDAAKAVWGRAPELCREKWIGAWRMYSIDGRSLTRDQCALALCMKCHRPLKGLRLVMQRPDGSRTTVAAFPAPLRTARNRVTGAVNVLVPVVNHEHENSKYEAARS